MPETVGRCDENFHKRGSHLADEPPAFGLLVPPMPTGKKQPHSGRPVGSNTAPIIAFRLLVSIHLFLDRQRNRRIPPNPAERGAAFAILPAAFVVVRAELDLIGCARYSKRLSSKSSMFRTCLVRTNRSGSWRNACRDLSLTNKYSSPSKKAA